MTPRLARLDAWVLVYLYNISDFSSWNSHGRIMSRSPSRIHMRFFSFPGILPILDLPSAHMTLILEAPMSWSAIANISRLKSFGMGERTCSSGVPGFFPLYAIQTHQDWPNIKTLLAYFSLGFSALARAVKKNMPANKKHALTCSKTNWPERFLHYNGLPWSGEI